MMRKFLAVVALLGGAASVHAAEPQKWCAEDGKQIVQTSTDTFILDGRALTSDEWEMTDVDDRDDGQSKAALILIKTNRIFWPCNKSP